MEKFNFTPENGFEDGTHYPNPTSESEIRKQLQRPLNQIKDFINNLISKLNGTEGYKEIGTPDGTLENTLNKKVEATTFNEQINKKVDKQEGKELSTNDFTNDLKTKLEGIETGAQKNPTSLKNPNKLKFEGIVSGEYDGSNEVTINIPSNVDAELKEIGKAADAFVTGKKIDVINNSLLSKLSDTSEEPVEGNIPVYDAFLNKLHDSGVSTEQIKKNTEEISKIKEDIDDLMENGSGLNETSSKLLIKVLRNGLYAINMSGDIDTLETELGANIVSYSITNNLTNATNNNVETSIKEGFSYSASIVASEGYILSNVTVTMGGTDITSEVYSGGVINIPSVSGNIVITAIAIVSETTMYSITNTFTNVSTDNPSTSVEENGGYSATLTPTSGYLLETVTVTMGGVDITSTAYANGVVTISSVTGNVVITAIASEPQSEEVVMLKSITGDGASYIDTEVLPQKSHRYEISFTSATDGEGDFVGGTLFGVDCYAYASAYLGVWAKNTTITSVKYALNNSGGTSNGSWYSSENNNLTNKQVYFVMDDGLQAIYLDENYTVRQTHGGDTNGTATWNDRENDVPPYPMYLFYVNKPGNENPFDIGSHTFYWFKVFDNSTNELLHEFVPAMSGAKIGVYDNVTQKFHENIGTGTFSYEEVEA